MAVKYVFITGGVVSGLGKGITAASLGRLLKARGFKVTMQKFDPYLNFDPGTMNPYQHGEVFVTEDGAETDLDLGHYERFIDEHLGRHSNITSGRVYWDVISSERDGDFHGGTVQVIPHITNCIKDLIHKNVEYSDPDVAIIEIGGTVGDIESLPFLEAIRQFSIETGRENCMYIHVTLVPHLKLSEELKTKPTQHSVKELLSIGIQPDMIVCRADKPLNDEIKDKIGLFCNISPENIIANLDMEILYEVPLALEKQDFAIKVCKRLGLPLREAKLDDWRNMVDRIRYPKEKVKIAIVGKYVALHDAYISVVESLKHGAISNDVCVDIKWVDSEKLSVENCCEELSNIDGILVPGGFGSRGIEGKICAVQFARENKIPFFGICLGLHMAIVEFSRNVIKLKGAHSTEFDADTPYPVIDFLPEQKNITVLGGTMRLGKYPCKLKEGTLARQAYGMELISERHRHRYEVNNDFRQILEDNGMILCGTSPDDHIVEMIELKDHPWFVACQFHPEFKSRPNNPHPLFAAFIKAACKKINL